MHRPRKDIFDIYLFFFFLGLCSIYVLFTILSMFRLCFVYVLSHVPCLFRFTYFLSMFCLRFRLSSVSITITFWVCSVRYVPGIVPSMVPVLFRQFRMIRSVYRSLHVPCMYVLLWFWLSVCSSGYVLMDTFWLCTAHIPYWFPLPSVYVPSTVQCSVE